jgi:predicted molibdopterin-dependent oxidoreductase YjgC
MMKEHYYAAQKAARTMGTNHIDNSARLCAYCGDGRRINASAVLITSRVQATSDNRHKSAFQQSTLEGARDHPVCRKRVTQIDQIDRVLPRRSGHPREPGCYPALQELEPRCP